MVYLGGSSGRCYSREGKKNAQAHTHTEQGKAATPFRRHNTMKGTGPSGAGKADSKAGQLAKRSDSADSDHGVAQHHHHHHHHPPAPAPTTPSAQQRRIARHHASPGKPPVGLTYDTDFLRQFKCSGEEGASTPMSGVRSRSKPSREGLLGGPVCTPVDRSGSRIRQTKSRSNGRKHETPVTPDASKRDALQHPPLPLQPLLYSPCSADSDEDGCDSTPVRFSSLGKTPSASPTANQRRLRQSPLASLLTKKNGFVASLLGGVRPKPQSSAKFASPPEKDWSLTKNNEQATFRNLEAPSNFSIDTVLKEMLQEEGKEERKKAPQQQRMSKPLFCTPASPEAAAAMQPASVPAATPTPASKERGRAGFDTEAPINPIDPLLPPTSKAVNLNNDMKRSGPKRCPTAPPPGAKGTSANVSRRPEPVAEEDTPPALTKKAMSFTSLARAHSQRAGEKAAATTPSAKSRAPQPPSQGRLPPTPTSSRKRRMLRLLGSPETTPRERQYCTPTSPDATVHCLDMLLETESPVVKTPPMQTSSPSASLLGSAKEVNREAVTAPRTHTRQAKPVVPASVSNIDCLWSAPGAEDANDYGSGGYFATKRGQRIGPNGRYHVVSKLGWGGFSTVWLCWDEAKYRKIMSIHEKTGTLPQMNPTEQFVAVKVSKCSHSVLKNSREEVTLLQYLSKRLDEDAHGMGQLGQSRLVSLLDHFEQQGKHGMHICMVFPVMGQNLLTLVEQGHRHEQSIGTGVQKGMRNDDDKRFIRETIKNMLLGMVVLEKLGVVHTDLKPENILLTSISQRVRKLMRQFQNEMSAQKHTAFPERLLVPTTATYSEASGSSVITSPHTPEVGVSGVKIGDFGLSIPLDPEGVTAPYDKHFAHAFEKFGVTHKGIANNTNGVTMQTREYRAPEILYGHPFTCETDVWSAGCIAFELITGTFLLDPKKGPKNLGPKSEDQVNIDHVCIMQQLLGTHSVKADSGRHAGKYFNSDGSFKHRSRAAKVATKRRIEEELMPFIGSRSEAAEVASFISLCLTSHDPRKRPSAAKCLTHSWFKDTAELRRI